MINIFKRTTKFSRLTAILATLSITAVSSVALASGFSVLAVGGLQQVEYPSSLMVQYNGINYQAFLTSQCSGIPGYNADTLKIWASLAQASLLSGKNMVIYYNDCGGAHYINDLVLQK